MTYFPWDPSLETGNELIDEQHQGLFALANALQVALIDHVDDDETVANAIYGLTDYVVEHFADEEALMRSAGYPEVSTHRSLHEQLSGDVLRLAAEYFNEDDVVPDTLAPFLTSWLQNHIRAEDMRFIEFVKAAG